MAKRGKNYIKAQKKVNPTEAYNLSRACAVLKETKRAKFDESADVAINLGVDPRHADQMVRGAIVLPHGTGKKIRVAVFAKGSKADEAKAAGADVVGAEDLATKIENGFMDFDRVIAHPELMAVVGKLGRVLGPRGLMPNPKVGTVTVDIGRAVEEAKGGKVEFRVDKTGTIHAPFGRASFDLEKLHQNLKTLLEAVLKAKPHSLKGQYMKKVVISFTMGPGVKVDVADAMALLTQ
jgi:large subunit ribosomal protein L1